MKAKEKEDNFTRYGMGIVPFMECALLHPGFAVKHRQSVDRKPGSDLD